MDGSSSGRHAMIRGEQVWLRPTEPTDIELFLSWFNDAETISYLAARAPMGRASEERWLERMLESDGKSSFHFVMCRLSDGQPIGTIGLFDLDHVNGNAGVGIVIGEKSLWGKGFGTDAMSAILDFAFGELRLERVWLDVYAGNDRARRSYLKAGFKPEGTLRRAHFQHGKYLDVHRMGIVREEWLALTRPRSWEVSARDAAGRE